MGKIVLKTAKRETTVKRSVVRDAVTSAFLSSSSLSLPKSGKSPSKTQKAAPAGKKL
jgi:hypothetical protein